MALFNSISAAETAGSMVIIEKSSAPPMRFPIINGPITTYWLMTLATERREYLALTYSAANTAVTANAQPVSPADGETWSWSMAETNRPAGAHKVIRLSEVRTYEMEGA